MGCRFERRPPSKVRVFITKDYCGTKFTTLYFKPFDWKLKDIINNATLQIRIEKKIGIKWILLKEYRNGKEFKEEKKKS
jgi:hypothetical protein